MSDFLKGVLCEFANLCCKSRRWRDVRIELLSSRCACAAGFYAYCLIFMFVLTVIAISYYRERFAHVKEDWRRNFLHRKNSILKVVCLLILFMQSRLVVKWRQVFLRMIAIALSFDDQRKIHPKLIKFCVGLGCEWFQGASHSSNASFLRSIFRTSLNKTRCSTGGHVSIKMTAIWSLGKDHVITRLSGMKYHFLQGIGSEFFWICRSCVIIHVVVCFSYRQMNSRVALNCRV